MKMLSTKQLNRLTCLASCRIVPSRMFRGIIKEEEYVKEAQYPEIPQYLSENEAEFAALKEQMRSLKTVEEKQLYLNKPKYYGWYSCVMDPNKVLPTSLDFLQFVTNTTIINDDLPNPLKNLENIAQEEAQRLEPIVKKHLLLQSQVEQAFQVPNDRAEFQEMGGNNMEAGRHSYIRKASEYKLQSLHRILHLHLSQNHPHLMQQTTGINPRVEAFWMRSGMQPDMRMVRKRRKLFEYKKKKRYPKDMLDEEEGKLWKEYDNALQIQGNHCLHVRSETLLDQFIDIEDEICQSGSEKYKIPQWNYASKTTGYPHFNQHGTNVPGTWTGSSLPFVNLAYVNSFNFCDAATTERAWNPSSEDNEREDMLNSKAILSSFGILMPTACYLGFDPFNDLKNPLSTNVVISDGRNFKFTSYQLNKTELVDANENSEESIVKTPRNVMWNIPEQPLFEDIYPEAGHVEGFNQEVLTNLIKFSLIKPTLHPERIQNQDHLGKSKYLHNHKHAYDRNYAFNMHRMIYSKRGRHIPKPDIEMWEKVYRLQHNTMIGHRAGLRDLPWYKMAMYDKLGKFHWHPEFRQLDYYIPAYNPRKYRPQGKRKGWGYNRVKKVFPPLEENERPNNPQPKY